MAVAGGTAANSPRVEQGTDLVLTGRVLFERGAAEAATDLAQAVHVRVYSPAGDELEYFRNNVLFEGRQFQVALPISYSEPPGRYLVAAEHAITGMKAKTWVDVVKKGAK